MRYWWVNQNQTYQHEVPGGYMWSPKRNKNGARNPFYDFMREVAPRDIVFSFAQTRIKAIGIARSYCYEAPKPSEFGNAGAHWDMIGWRVDVRFVEIRGAIQPGAHIEQIRPRLPVHYGPLLPDGRGKQNVYLTVLSSSLAELLVDLIGGEARDLILGATVSHFDEDPPSVGLVEWEEHEVQRVSNDLTISATDRRALVNARRGQGLFKRNVRQIEHACRITRVDNIEHLRASHCKPWRDSSNEERLDGENGLLLTPSIDHLFDRGFISFDNAGQFLISPIADVNSLQKMGVPSRETIHTGGFSAGQRHYLEFHRENVFLHSRYIDELR